MRSFSNRAKMIFPCTSFLLVCIALTTLLIAGERKGYAIQAFSEQVTRIVKTSITSNSARHPVMVKFHDQLYLFWTEGYPTALRDKSLLPAFMTLTGRDDYCWLWHWAPFSGNEIAPINAKGKIGLPLLRAGSLWQRPAICADGQGLLSIYPRRFYEVPQTDAAKGRLPVATTELPSGAVYLFQPPLTVLPHSLPNTKYLGEKPAPDSLTGQWFTYYVLGPPRDFKRLDLCRDEKTKTFFLAGENHISGNIWVSYSSDGVTWQEPIVLAQGPAFPAVGACEDKVILTYTEGASSLYQNQWYDDDPPGSRPDYYYWPATGTLKYRLSGDGGKAWSEPKTLVKTKNIISSRIFYGTDGVIRVVYVESLGYEATRLCLVSSSDGGKTWTEAEPITDGKSVDRDPCITVWKNKVYVAFSRYKGINAPSSIWYWQKDISSSEQR
ncbi:MAG: sialidase family protein [bacterium]|nr:sialidase family protein [bacterium]